MALQDPKILPLDYKFDTEAELRQIKFTKQVAQQQDQYVSSVERGEYIKNEIEIQRSLNYGIREFFNERDRVINLGLNMCLWFITVFCYQINDYYDYYFPGDQFEALMSLSVVELSAYIVADFVYERFSSTPNKKLFYFAYTIAITGSAIIAINNQSIDWLDLFGEFVTKFGIACAF